MNGQRHLIYTVMGTQIPTDTTIRLFIYSKDTIYLQIQFARFPALLSTLSSAPFITLPFQQCTPLTQGGSGKGEQEACFKVISKCEKSHLI